MKIQIEGFIDLNEDSGGDYESARELRISFRRQFQRLNIEDPPTAAARVIVDGEYNPAIAKIQEAAVSLVSRITHQSCGGLVDDFNLVTPKRTVIHGVEHTALALTRGNTLGGTIGNESLGDNMAIIVITNEGLMEEEDIRRVIERAADLTNRGFSLVEKILNPFT